MIFYILSICFFSFIASAGFLVLMQPGLDYQLELFLFLVQWLELSIPWCITDYW